VKEAARSLKLSRRGYAAAVDHPSDRPSDRNRALRGSATILTLVLLAISAAELAWILTR